MVASSVRPRRIKKRAATERNGATASPTSTIGVGTIHSLQRSGVKSGGSGAARNAPLRSAEAISSGSDTARLLAIPMGK